MTKKKGQASLETPINNLVAKHSRNFNKSAIMVDRVKRQKAGYRKHKGSLADQLPLIGFLYPSSLSI